VGHEKVYRIGKADWRLFWGGERGISDRRFYFLEFPDDFRVTQGYV
jgi:hypothetical protein